MRGRRSWKDVARVVAGLTTLVLLLEAGLCGSSSTDDPVDAVRIKVTLANLDTQNIHILVSDEPFREGAPPAGNRLSPGLTREVEVGPFRVGDARSFSAGREMEIFATKSCRVTNASFTSKRARVEWLGFELHCSGW